MITLSAQDHATLQGLSKPVQDDVHFWRAVVNEVMASKLGRCEAFEAVAAARGLRWPTVRSKYYAALKRGWRGLVNGRKLGDNKISVHPEFIGYWHGLVLSNQRCTAKAFSRFVRAYHQGDPIPGVPAPGERPHRLPRGYGERNLCRPAYLPAKATLVMARQGVAAARAHLPHGPQDISEVRPLEYILFDDVELDFLVIVPESPTPVKVRLIVAMDLCSRMILGYGFRPGITRPDGKEDSLKLRDMKMVVAQVIRTWGVPRDYKMHFICERGTAALPHAVKAALGEISNGQIVCHDTSMIVGQVFEFRDKATGNSWGKAWLESFFKGLHGELAHLPGQKGMRYELAPAEMDGRKKELAQLVKLGRRLPLELRYEFTWPFLTSAEALNELDAAFARLHHRRNHNLNCFERCPLWRLSAGDVPKPMSELPEVLMDRVNMLLWDTSQPETSHERFMRLVPGKDERMGVADSALMMLMEEQRRVKFEDLHFCFEREGTKYIYLPSDTMLPLLGEGKYYILWFHPQDMGTMYVSRDRPHLGYVGKLTRFTAGKKGEMEDAKAYLKEKRRMFDHASNAALQPLVGRLRQQADVYASNTEILDRARALEVEVEVVRPTSSGGAMEIADVPASMVAMQTDMAETAATRARIRRVDIVADTLNRPRKERTDLSEAYA